MVRHFIGKSCLRRKAIDGTKIFLQTNSAPVVAFHGFLVYFFQFLPDNASAGPSSGVTARIDGHYRFHSNIRRSG